MEASEARRRPHPADRFAGAEHVLDLGTALEALRSERGPNASGHRQITLLHHGPVRMVLFAFAAGGRLPDHRAPGWITIHVLRGAIAVRTAEARHTLGAGQLLALDPGVSHDVEASEESDMLLGVYPPVPMGSSASGA